MLHCAILPCSGKVVSLCFELVTGSPHRQLSLKMVRECEEVDEETRPTNYLKHQLINSRTVDIDSHQSREKADITGDIMCHTGVSCKAKKPQNFSGLMVLERQL